MYKIKQYFRNTSNILTFVFLSILIIAGFILRTRNLGYLSFWGDDGHTFVGTMSILKYGFPRLPSGNILWHGIFDYYLKALPVLILGAKEFSFRIVSVISGVGTAVAVYFAGKEMANKYVGFLGAAVMTLSTWYIQFAREARYYSDFQFFFILSMLFFYIGFIKDRKPFRVLAAVFMVLTSLIQGTGITLIFLFIILVIFKGKNFFKKEIIIPMSAVIFLDALQIINQVFFWKVGRSFYAADAGTKAMIKAYLKLPDPFYFKIVNMMFPKMFYVFVAGAGAFLVLIIFFSLRKKMSGADLYLNENLVKWGPVKWPFNIFLLYVTYTAITVFLSLGNMYSQQRYIYFLMPVFVICFSYTVYLVSMLSGSLIIKIFKKKPPYLFHVLAAVIFLAASVFLVNGIDFKEAWHLPYIKHNEKLNVMYSISNSWNIHRDAATAGRYVAGHLQPDDIVITVDIYNSPPYTGKVDYWLWTGNLVSWAPYHNEGSKVIEDTYGVEVLRNLSSFINVMNENTGKNIWVLTNQSLFTKEHIEPSIRQLLDKYSQNIVLTGRDDVSRLYFFPKTSGQRINLDKVFSPQNENIINMQGKKTVDFDFRNEAAQKYLIYGFSNVEKGYGTWALGDTSVLFLKTEDIPGDYELEIKARPLDNKKERQKMALIVNNNKIGEFEFLQAEDLSLVTFIIPGNSLKQGVNDIVFKYNYSTSPKELKMGSDGRKLSVLFQDMLIRSQ